MYSKRFILSYRLLGEYTSAPETIYPSLSPSGPYASVSESVLSLIPSFRVPHSAQGKIHFSRTG